ncbi:BspA family leucine-rich repeat surface protein [Flagellimonas flava]|uniref:Surface protein n=1 Tax=Flagellimonas flava TaxID=570519 RepID=A0A1M5Q1F0_9FLAO|nr:BspA family leucine-rich repeat surface protein [Allomuricauda flava]SHH07955.1 surface protein [Allomuricauda flava]
MKLKALFTLVFCAIISFSCEEDPVQENRPPTLEDQTFTVSEKTSPVDEIGTLKVVDPDGDPISFSIETNDNDFFVMTNRGTISLANGKRFDFEMAESHNIMVSASDGTASDNATVTIRVIGTDLAPIVNSNAFTVMEDISTTDIIGTVEAEDPEGEELAFSIADQNPLFQINNNGELSLAEDQNLDYETSEFHKVNIEVSDGTNTTQKQITINVQNVIDPPYALEKSSFVVTFKTTLANEEVGFGADENLPNDYILDWGDGTIEKIDKGSPQSHVYEKPGTYKVAINGQFSRIIMDNHPSATKLMSIENWGAVEWKNFRTAFKGCSNLTYNATDAPNLSTVTDLAYMFRDASSFNGDVSNWDVSKVTNMEQMFYGASSFNSDLSSWELKNVLYINSMFQNATSFNGDVTSWNVSKVKSMANTFNGADSFDQNLGGWNITAVTNISGMLSNSKLSVENYSNTLIGWEGQEGTPTGITLGAHGLEYCGFDAVIARNTLTDIDGLDWVIQGDEGCPQP